MIPPTSKERDTPCETVVSLPWPEKALNPNSRVHWATKAKAVKSARGVAHWVVHLAIGRQLKWSRASISMTFCPPVNRRRDLDNLIASAKGLSDGIADALGIDDSKFECSYRIGEPVKGGSVRVEIRGIS